MAVDIRQDGSFEITYTGPYGGLNVQMPENLIPDSQTPAVNDFMFRNAELRSRFAFNPTYIAAPEAGVAIKGIGNFQNAPWALMADGKFYTFSFITNVWTLQGTMVGNTLHAVQARVFQNKLYLVNGGDNLASWDGGAFVASVASVAGNPVGAFLLDELDNHLLMAVTNENLTQFPQRIRWSASGLPAVWDPAANINAGLNDFLEVPDNITALMMLGRIGYIIRTDGITEAAPTGNGVAPFDFNHLWASQFGIGNTKFFASAQYGTTGVIVGRDNIYSIQAVNVQPIGGSARDAILADIGFGSYGVSGGAIVISQPQQIYSIIVPYIKSDVILDGALTGGELISKSSDGSGTAPYLLYMLFVPKVSRLDGVTILGTNIWVYSFEDQNWTKWVLPGQNISGSPSLLYSFVINIPVGPQLAFPTVNNAGVYNIGVFNVNNFNDPAQGSSYSYRVEDVFTHRVPTVRRAVMTYRDLGPATITATLTGTDDNATVQSITTPSISIGNTIPTGVLMTKFIDIELTAFRPQLTINRAAGAGPLSIAKMVIVGQVEREVTL